MWRVVVVGGGVLGMMHAAAARDRGDHVVHLEREPGSRGASVRNFGLIWVSGRAPGPELELALRSRELWERDLVVLCTGAAHTGIVGPHLAGHARPPVRRVRLQMLQTEPLGRRLTTSVADGDSLRYYPAYDLPGRARLAPQQPAAAAAGAQLLLAQRLDGSLTIGDTHAYDEPFAFDLDERPYDHLRARAESLLGTSLPPTRLRWAGVYSQVTGTEIYYRSQVAPGVVLVTGTGGRGMTLAPAIAEQTFAA